METFQQEHGAEDLLTFTTKLDFSGKTLSEMRASLDGRAELSGTELLLCGLNLDEQQAVLKRPSAAFCSSLVTVAYWVVRLIPREFASLAFGHVESACEHRMFQHAKRYRSTQRFNLVDFAAFFVAGPVGVAITRGYGFASLFADTDQQTPIRELVSKWDIENGIARARDVALSTAENRFALAGGLGFVNLQFEDVRVAVIDAKGRVVVEQSIQGNMIQRSINLMSWWAWPAR